MRRGGAVAVVNQGAAQIAGLTVSYLNLPFKYK
jgi:hypothetical protein